MILARLPADLHHNLAILIILLATYAGIALGHVPGLKIDRTGLALLGAIAMMIFGGVTTPEVVSYVSWPTIFLLFGFFVISAQLRLSGFYHAIAGAISARLGHPARFLLILMILVAALSAVMNHDIICLVFAPIVGSALLRQRINPIPFLVALAIASNVGSGTTLIGNAQDMAIGTAARLSFGRYLLWSVVPVAVALAASYGVVWLLSYRTLKTNAPSTPVAPDPDYPFDRPHAAKGIVLLVVVIGCFFTSLPKEVVALAAAAVHLASNKFNTRDILGLVDWSVLVLFMGLFIITGSFQSTGYGDQLVHWLAGAGLNLNTPPVLIAATTLLTNTINNSAAVMLLLKVIDLSHPTTAYVLALANSFGGSLIVIGSVANLIVVEQARAIGIRIGFWDFARLGIPATLAALASLLLWVML